ncbi:MAG: flagellar hook protein FlgE [Desulfovibrio sp.]|nr:flagellar hook protein FlgE [Desulfovibrio sp.]
MSGLSASMWTSVSGLVTHGNKMNVVGNNLANVSTLGFKAQRADFCDYLYVGASTYTGGTQIGQGVATMTLIGDFSQGSLESTNSVTDIAIDGNGFFRVCDPKSGNKFYTRAGDFYFNADRELQNPDGLLLQGWKVNNHKSISFNDGSTAVGSSNPSKSSFVGYGTPGDIVLDSWNVPPQQTTNVTVTMGLTNDDNSDRCSSTTNPMTALFNQWDGTNDPPMPDSAYAAQSSINVYDQGGNAHELTVYYDKVNSSKTDSTGATTYKIEGLPAGYTVYEYVVTMPPADDKRSYGGTYDASTGILSGETKFSDTKMAGMLMTGHLIFNASGELVNQTGYTYGAQQELADNARSELDPTALESWQPTKFSNNGLPTFTPNFEGFHLANSVSEAEADEHIIELDFGVRNVNTDWSAEGGSLADLSIAEESEEPSVQYSSLRLMKEPSVQEYASAANAVSPTVQDANQDGFPSGILNNVNITDNGIVYGMYSNGESLPLYQIAMYDFKCEQGLYRQGGNLFSATMESGDPREDVPGENGFGSTKAYNIEQSNVDMAKEFVHMISTQRGFQANSKAITTTDTMMETVIGMKR